VAAFEVDFFVALCLCGEKVPKNFGPEILRITAAHAVILANIFLICIREQRPRQFVF
jgi:hypothetical protein